MGGSQSSSAPQLKHHELGVEADGTAADGVRVTLEDLDLPPRRDGMQLSAAQRQMLEAAGVATPQGASSSPDKSQAPGSRVAQEIAPGGEAQGQKAFKDDGLVGTEPQQLRLLSYYAELSEDFRAYQRRTRADGAPRDIEGAQLVLLSGEPGTGKTRHAVSFAKALGLPLMLANAPAGGARWAAQLRQEVQGRDCMVFFDEIDQNCASDETFASELRQFLDGVCQPSGSRVLLVGTTNRLKKLPEDVRHRAEVINFDRPHSEHLEEMWRGYAQHLKSEDMGKLAMASARAKITGRDVRHCAASAERQAAIIYLNAQRNLGFCHGSALSNCPGPAVEEYLQCVHGRQVE